MSRSDLDYLRHVRDEAEYLTEASGETDREAFLASGTLRRAFARSIEVIGEATKNLSPAFREQHPDLDWRAMAGMRDRLIHAYFGVDDEIVWDVASSYAPALARQIARILGGENSESRSGDAPNA